MLPYELCCGRYIDGGALAPDASLMRSRYSAFVLVRVDHLRYTWHPRTCPEALSLESGQKWLGLEVRAHRALGADRAEVEFVARSRCGGRGIRLHETSRFERVDGRWLYVDGDLH
ncbi:MAG: YchJ family metal-binding protein [Burkholderiaceae bacterium]